MSDMSYTMSGIAGRPKVSLMIYNEVLLVDSPKKEEFRNIERFAKN